MKQRRFGEEKRLAFRLCFPVKRPMLWISGAAFASMLIAVRAPLWAVAAMTFAGGISLLFSRLRWPLWALLCGTATVCFCVCTMYRLCVVLPIERLAGTTDTVHAQVWDTDSENRYILRVTAAKTVPAGTRFLLYCPDLTAPTPGDTVTVRVTLRAMTDIQNSYRAKGIHLQGEITDYLGRVEITGQYALPWYRQVQAFLSEQVNLRLPGDEGAVLSTLCFGGQSALPVAVEGAFRDSGIAHLLVVSGLHLTVLTGCIQGFLRIFGLNRRVAAGITLPLVLLFMPVVGLSPSVLRAGLMCLIWLMGHILRRRPDGLNSLGLAALLLLLYNPYMAGDAGFLLSFAATCGLLCFASRLCDRVGWQPTAPGRIKAVLARSYNAIATTVSVTGAAMAFLLPLLCYFFGGFPLITPLANLLTALPSSIALLTGWGGALLCAVPGCGWLGEGLLLIAGGATRCTTELAMLCARQPLWIAAPDLWITLLITGLCLGFALCLFSPRKVRCQLLSGLAAATILAGVIYRLHTAGATTVTSAETGQVLLVETPEGTGLVVADGQLLRSAKTLLKQTGCRRLDFAVIGQTSPVYVGDLAVLLREVETETIYTEDAPLSLTDGPAITQLSVSQRLFLQTDALLVRAVETTQ